MAAALAVVLLLVLDRLDALAGVADALAEFAQVQFLNVLRLLAGCICALQHRGAGAIQRTHVDALVQQVLPAQFVIVHGRIGRFSWSRIVPWRARAAIAVARYSSFSRILGRHLSLLEHVLLVVLGHDAHLLAARIRPGTSALRLVALLRILTLAWCHLHACGVAVLLRLRRASLDATRAILFGGLEICLALVVLGEHAIHAHRIQDRPHVWLVATLQEAASGIALL